jgi:hypothetical protein
MEDSWCGNPDCDGSCEPFPASGPGWCGNPDCDGSCAVWVMPINWNGHTAAPA